MIDSILEVERMIEKFAYPEFSIKIIKSNFIDFGSWYLIDKSQIITRIEGLKERFPNRKLIPFARRDDNDDIACFEIGYDEKVFIIHDFSSNGYENRGEFDNFKSWFIHTIKDMLVADIGESF